MANNLKTLRLAVFLSGALMLAACGGAAHGTVADVQTGPLSVSAAAKKALEKMETSAFSGAAGKVNCHNKSGSFGPEVTAALDAAAPYLAERTDIRPPVVSAILMDNPPRPEESIAVYICDGMETQAYTIFRSVFISSGFMQRLKNDTSAAGDTAFRSALAFVLYHEIGHAALNHSAGKLDGGGAFSLPQELEADQFAYDLMAATGTGYSGVDAAKFAASGGPPSAGL